MSVLSYIPFTKRGEDTSVTAVICLGKFDGVHIGHARLLEETKTMSGKLGARACALCFSPTPAEYFSKFPVSHILTLEEKIDIFKKSGLDGVYVCNFEKIYDYSPHKFIEDILVSSCNCVGAVCGFNYRFGYKASGTPEDLGAHFENFKKVPEISVKGQTVSASLIKEKIENGDVSGANEMLGRPYSISHTVVHGKNLGAKLGFPTVNHVFGEYDLIPGFGIYATISEIDGKEYVSVTNVGIRPTVSESGTVTCETHIINCESDFDLYGKQVEIRFIKKLRDEKRFSSVDELSSAIAADVENTKKFFNLTK